MKRKILESDTLARLSLLAAILSKAQVMLAKSKSQHKLTNRLQHRGQSQVPRGVIKPSLPQLQSLKSQLLANQPRRSALPVKRKESKCRQQPQLNKRRILPSHPRGQDLFPRLRLWSCRLTLSSKLSGTESRRTIASSRWTN